MLKIAKLFHFCHLKKMVRPETFRPYYVYYKMIHGPYNIILVYSKCLFRG